LLFQNASTCTATSRFVGKEARLLEKEVEKDVLGLEREVEKDVAALEKRAGKVILDDAKAVQDDIRWGGGAR
jgi:hypothetical protein